MPLKGALTHALLIAFLIALFSAPSYSKQHDIAPIDRHVVEQLSSDNESSANALSTALAQKFDELANILSQVGQGDGTLSDDQRRSLDNVMAQLAIVRIEMQVELGIGRSVLVSAKANDKRVYAD